LPSLISLHFCCSCYFFFIGMITAPGECRWRKIFESAVSAGALSTSSCSCTLCCPPELPGDSIGGSGSYYDPYSVMDNMSVFSAASSVNPNSMRGIVHRVWNDFDNRCMKGLFGGKPHDDVSTLFDSIGGSSTGGPPNGPGGIGVSASSAHPYQFNSALNPAEHINHPNSPLRAQQQAQHPTQHLFPLTENSAINSSVTAAAAGGDRADHGTFGREETKVGDVAAVPPRQGPSGGQPI
ncbi:unnamed protein product, partial [Scytosiphon promiscuus]